MKALVLALSLLLVSCANKPTIPVEAPVANTRVVVEPELLKPCPPLEQLPKDPSIDQIIAQYLKTIELYAQCKLQNSAAISAIRKLANLEKP